MLDRICTKCGETKPLTSFRYRKRKKRAKIYFFYEAECNSCNSLRDKAYRAIPENRQKANLRSAQWLENNREQNRTSSRAYYRAHLNEIRSQAIQKLYGISHEEYERLYREQCGQCAICKTHRKVLCIDHCHSSEKVRGLLCNRCNLGLGLMYDDPRLMKNAFVYLQDYHLLNEYNIIYDSTNRTKAFRKHRIHETDYAMLYQQQSGCCAICNRALPSLHVDHCHDTGCVRGLLCQTCNKGLGLFQDNGTILLNGAHYVASANALYK